MKRKLHNLRWLAALFYCFLSWTSSIMAEEYALYIADTQVTDANCNNLSGDKFPGVTVAPGGIFKYDPDKKILTMKEVTVVVGNNESAIWNGIVGLKIEVSGTNELKSTTGAGLQCNFSTQIGGNGILTTVSGGSGSVYIADKNATLTISDITLEVSGQWGIVGEDGKRGEMLKLKNASVIAKGTKGAIRSWASFSIDGCEIVSPAGGKFDKTKLAVVDAAGNMAMEVKIAPIAVTGK